jgi:NitT/TauT family transport system ATP-binding protein
LSIVHELIRLVQPTDVPAATTKIRLRGLEKQFTVRGRSVQALAGIDLDIRDGEFFCIVGPSGCGKTTLLRFLADLETRSSGTIEVARTGAARGSATARPLNSMVFQDQSIFPWMNVRDNVAFGLKARGLSKRDRYAIVEPFIRKVGLGGFEHALPHQLSGGMKQRVSIARAFANDPEILLMDEPFSALDEQTKLVLQAELLRIWEDRAVRDPQHRRGDRPRRSHPGHERPARAHQGHHRRRRHLRPAPPRRNCEE